MYYHVRRKIRDLGYRGWLLLEEGDQFHLSKFDERFNEDEYRFYIEEKKGSFSVVYCEKIKGCQKSVKVQKQNPYLHKANEICQKLSLTGLSLT